MKVAVLRAGYQTTVQDPGRFGERARGVSVGGALDPHALRVANLLVGNEPHAAGIETTLGKLRLRFTDERLIAWCGGRFEVLCGNAPLSAGRTALLRAGEEVQLNAAMNPARSWLAISGGVDVPLVLSSRSTDLRSRFGGFEGRALKDGDLLPLGRPSEFSLRVQRRLPHSQIADWFAPREWSNTKTPHGILRVVRGSAWPEFSPAAVGSLTRATFTVTSDSDRMGVRLDGPELTRTRTDELLSEAVTPGTIQVPRGGRPILLLGDCQTIGGYPRIAHVITVDLPAAAQLGPGDQVRFMEISLPEAHALWVERERDLELFELGLKLRLA